MKRYGLKQMHELSDNVAKDVAKHYFNVMAIRHPFDRLVAYYRDKMVDTDKSSNHPKIAAAILREFRPQLFVNNKTLSKMNYPQQAVGAPTFKEFMTWIYKNKVMNEHWNFIFETCHPCAHDWGAILRVETMEMDGQLFAKLVNSSHSRIPVRHSHENKPNYLQFGKTLNQFFDLSDELVDYFLEFFKHTDDTVTESTEFFCQTLKGTIHQYLEELVVPYQPRRSLRSESGAFLAVPTTRGVIYGNRCFRKAAPTLWNNLPVNI
ncbi:hypothetical protein LSH36_2299g00008 [Paralvinella palmiformis]|uniref:Carbohydrate sulfotransferase n=1 Tax=Paralvinella palmiformis TaxID=53620 RepID=A0AAD9MQ57_9ANNE|nr:hypothetical protein LSH36_2299g00008 [Paralvinella palmiformis]